LLIGILDLTKVMDPPSSRTLTHDLTNLGVYPIWSSEGTSNGRPLPPSSISARAQEVALDPPPRSSAASREPVRQGSAAWASLRQQALPKHVQSAHQATTRDANTTHSHVELDDEYLSCIEKLNRLRIEEQHVGHPGNHRLPKTNRLEIRNMILAVCRDVEPRGSMDDIGSYVLSC